MPKVIQMHHYGDPHVLHLADVTPPPLQPNEVRLRVIAAAVNRADLEIRRGTWPILAQNPFPYTPGLEATGDVVETGRDVDTINVGEAETLARVPPHLDPFDVAALGLAAVTALNGIKRLQLGAGQTVVIHGASGGVGSAAIAIAQVFDARVVATTSNAAKREYLRGLGADDVVTLGEQRLPDCLGSRSVDSVLETIGRQTFPDSVAVLKRGGRLCLVGAASGPGLCFSAWDLLQDLHLTGYIVIIKSVAGNCSA